MKSSRFFFTALLICTFTVAAQAKNGIRWEPAGVSRQSIAGTVTSMQVQFRSDVTLSNVSLRIVPTLSRFISLSPSTFNAVPAGSVQNVNITFTVPKGTTPQTFDGTIQVKSGNATVAQPLPVILEVVEATSTQVPPTISLPSPDRIGSVSGESNFRLVLDEIDVFFEEGTDPSLISDFVGQLGGTFVGSDPELGFYQIQFPDQGYDYISVILSQIKQNPNVAMATPRFFLGANNFPSDPGTDQSYGPTMIHLPEAWDITTGKKEVVLGPRDVEKINIAVVDTVFDVNNPDLKDNITSYSFNSAPQVAPYHGTRTSSIIGAKGNNGIGIAGVMWDASLYLYGAGKYDDPRGLDGALMDVAFSRAIRDGARVLNLSWGGSCEHSPCSAQEERALKQLDDSFIYFIVLDALVQNYAPSVQDFQLLPTSRRARSRPRCERTDTALIR
jgi:hypothetical protein